ncbi:hypothetical protein JTB14_026749 [Gonioctena quinquepunctata]|nr:hypothetical protein JTB14_026749 [Gonioctena quinquepunctata]
MFLLKFIIFFVVFSLTSAEDSNPSSLSSSPVTELVMESGKSDRIFQYILKVMQDSENKIASMRPPTANNEELEMDSDKNIGEFRSPPRFLVDNTGLNMESNKMIGDFPSPPLIIADNRANNRDRSDHSTKLALENLRNIMDAQSLPQNPAYVEGISEQLLGLMTQAAGNRRPPRLRAQNTEATEEMLQMMMQSAQSHYPVNRGGNRPQSRNRAMSLLRRLFHSTPFKTVLIMGLLFSLIKYTKASHKYIKKLLF